MKGSMTRNRFNTKILIKKETQMDNLSNTTRLKRMGLFDIIAAILLVTMRSSLPEDRI